jgi:hypothetical protein
LYVVTSDDYVQAFKQLTLYSHFKQGGRPCQGLDDELLLRRAIQFGELANVVLKYPPRSACKITIAHMEGEEIFGSYKWKANLAP